MKILSSTLYLVLLTCTSLGAETWKDISADIAGIIDDTVVPSMAIAVVDKDQILAAGAYGKRKAGSDEKVTIHDKYHFGSCGKSMTAVLAGRLVESGKIQWDTTLESVFMDLKIHKDFRPVKLEQLLTNSAGFPKSIPNLLWLRLWADRGSEIDQRMTLVKGMVKRKPRYLPGEGYEYSNTGFSIAGAMMEQLTGKSYESLMQQEVFGPLQMATAGFRAPATNGKVDQPYGHVIKGGRAVLIDPEPRGDNPAGIAPAGTMHCSILDFARYAQFHLGHHGQDVLKPVTLEKLHTPVGKEQYGMGWVVTERIWANGLVWTHTGSNTMNYAVMWLAPERGSAVVVMCNIGGDDIWKIVDQGASYGVDQLLQGR